MARLYEVLARAGVLDGRIGKVRNAQGELVLTAFIKLTPNGDTISKIACAPHLRDSVLEAPAGRGDDLLNYGLSETPRCDPLGSS
jgi:hypothetical protein